MTEKVTVAPLARLPIVHGKPLEHGAEAETNVSPAGVGSVIEAPVESDGPSLPTTRLKVTFVPADADPGPALMT